MKVLRAVLPEALGIEHVLQDPPLDVTNSPDPMWSPNLVQSIEIDAEGDSVVVGYFVTPEGSRDSARTFRSHLTLEDRRATDEDVTYNPLLDIYKGGFLNLEKLTYFGMSVTDETLIGHFPRLQHINGRSLQRPRVPDLVIDRTSYPIDSLLAEYRDDLLIADQGWDDGDEDSDEQSSSWGSADEDAMEDDAWNQAASQVASKVEESNASAAEEASELRPRVERAYIMNIRASIGRIVEVYTELFSAGYDLSRPVGVLTTNPFGAGSVLRGVAVSIEGAGKLETTSADDLIPSDLYEKVLKDLRLQECPARSEEEIANVLLGKGYQGRYVDPARAYLPFKMLEFAYGKIGKASSDGSSLEYHNADSISSWADYAKKIVEPSLKSLYLTVLTGFYQQSGETDLVADHFRQSVEDFLVQVERVLTTCLLLTKYDVSPVDHSIYSMRLRVAQSKSETGVSYSQDNIVHSYLNRRGIDGGSASSSYPAESVTVPNRVTGNEPNVVECSTHFHELDSKLANAEPRFTYKAIQALNKQGRGISWENMVIGVDKDDNIISAGPGKKINFSKNFSHLVIAGSRAGKGVLTLSLLQGVFAARRPLFYLDNKPDMGSLILEINPNAFVVNGNNMTVDPENGTDLYSNFAGADGWIPGHATPGYLVKELGAPSHVNYGGIYYFRALNLLWALLGARANNSADLAMLGGKDGVTIVVDELANAEENFGGLAREIASNQARSDYWSKFREWLKKYDEWENSGAGAEPREPQDKPTPYNYWARNFMDMIRESVSTVRGFQNAVFKNQEAGVSDMFVVTQHPTKFALDDSPTKYENMAPMANSTKNSKMVARPITALGYMALPFSFDAFIGYQADSATPELNYLGQNDRESVVGRRLGPAQRNFAYVESLEFSKITNKSLADSATFIKPFFVLPDGRDDGVTYPARNMLNVVELSGIPADTVRSRNLDYDLWETNNEKRLDSRVGFVPCLEETGVSLEEASANLDTAVEAVNYLLGRIGYPGTWREFVFDLRPQWQLSLKQMLAAYDGTFDPNDVENNLQEFYSVYPGEFEGVSATSKAFENGWSEEAPQEWSYDGDRMTFSANESSGAASPASVDGEAPGGTSSDSVSDSFESPFGTPEVDEDDEFADLFTDDKAEQPNSFDLDPSWHRLSESARRKLMGPPELPSDEELFTPQNQEYGDGSAPTAFGEPVRFDVPETRTRPLYQEPELLLGHPESMEVYRRWVSTEMVNFPGGPSGLRRIDIVDGTVIVNGVMFSLELTPQLLSRIPISMRVPAQSDQLMSSVQWAMLPNLTRLQTLSVSSFDILSEYIWSDIMPNRIVRKRAAEQVFAVLPTLVTLVIAGREYTRDSLRRSEGIDDPFNAPNGVFTATERAASFSSAWSSKMARGSFTAVRNLWGDPDAGLLTKVLGTTVGALGVTVGGAAFAGAQATKGANHGIKGFMDAFRQVFSEGGR